MTRTILQKYEFNTYLRYFKEMCRLRHWPKRRLQRSTKRFLVPNSQNLSLNIFMARYSIGLTQGLNMK